MQNYFAGLGGQNSMAQAYLAISDFNGRAITPAVTTLFWYVGVAALELSHPSYH